MSKPSKVYRSWDEFYPFYLTEHSDPVCRGLHVAGTTGVILLALWIIVTGNWFSLWLLPLCGYGCGWTGHFFFEKNKPATFKYPFYSLISDFRMWFDVVTGKEPIVTKRR
ncbi:membrane protein [Planoprotostelium fungivorum]|uniref:Membrane protein n=1 Tax=Planoprotostelium fungivorum TaxID=1890364 RepID=A0A2P6P008_9EUKA|nr:membrane protein [Planoprotostelium fungivorum]